MNRFLLFLFLASSFNAQASVFRLHMIEEPSSIFPQYKDRLSGQYLLGNLFSGYYQITESNALKPALMKSCIWKTETKLLCTPDKRKWSNGEVIKAKDHYNHLKRMLLPEAISPLKESFLRIVNYEKYLSGKSTWEQVGIKLINRNIEFSLHSPDQDFLYLLSHPALSPFPKNIDSEIVLGTDFATGPYKLVEWKRGRSVRLTRNPEHPVKIANPPDVHFLFIAEDMTALNLYEKGQLDFLRRMSTEGIRKYRKSPELHLEPFFRVDYLGFGPKLRKLGQSRRLLQAAFDGFEFKKTFEAKGRPGCFGIPKSLQQKQHCLKFGVNPTEDISWPRLKLHYSKQGGETMGRTMEWFQAQWKKNLGVNVQLISEDVKVLGAKLRSSPPDIFRRGVPLDRPTCLAALEVFHSKSPDNFIGFKDESFDGLVRKMKLPKTKGAMMKQLCSNGIKSLLQSGLLIPLGEIHFAMLRKPKFKGYTINGLNQLDLTRLGASN